MSYEVYRTKISEEENGYLVKDPDRDIREVTNVLFFGAEDFQLADEYARWKNSDDLADTIDALDEGIESGDFNIQVHPEDLI